MRKLFTWLCCLQFIILATTPALAGFGNDLNNGLSPTVQAFQRVCGEDSVPGSTLVSDSTLAQMCEVIGHSELCKGVKAEEKRDCRHPENNDASIGDGILSCLEGLFQSLSDLWDMVKGMLSFIYESATSSDKRAEISEETSAFLDSIALYFETEMAKAKDGMSGWFKDVRAGLVVSKKLFGKFIGMVTDVINQGFSKYACYNQEGQARITCKLVGDIFLPPAAFFAILKKGPQAFKLAVSQLAKKDPKLSLIENAGDTVPIQRGSPPTNIDDRTRPRPPKDPLELDPRVSPGSSTRMNDQARQYFNSIPAESQRMSTPTRPLNGFPDSPKMREIQELLSKNPGEGTYGIKKLGGGVTDTYLVELPDGTKGVFKPRDPADWASNYRAEILAYQVDHKLGLGLVPPTIEVALKGKMKGSFQRFVPNSKTAFDSDIAPNPKDLNKQSFFDYLIDNGDRHHGNYMVRESGQVISIDHGLSFTGKGYNGRSFEMRKPEIVEFMKTPEGQQAVAKLRAIKEASIGSFEREIAGYLGKKDAQRMTNRIFDLLDLADEVIQ